jgi:hypothetical protein
MLCDLVPGKETDAERIAQAANPSKELGGIDIKGIETVKLAKLHAIVTKKKYKQVSSGYDPVAEGSEEGPWVIPLPKDLVDALVALDAAGRKRAAAEWAKAEEFGLDGWKPAAVTKVLDAMCELAKSARKKKNGLFLWMSL